MNLISGFRSEKLKWNRELLASPSVPKIAILQILNCKNAVVELLTFDRSGMISPGTEIKSLQLEAGGNFAVG